MTTTTSIARAILLFLCLFSSIALMSAKTTDASESFACVEDITIMEMDCMFAKVGSSPCYGSYHVMYAPTLSDPYVSIGSYSSGTFYTITNDGCYKLKKVCGGVCHESNVIVYSGCTAEECELEIDYPYEPVIEHCFDADGVISFHAEDWVSGCNQVEYEWTTPIGTFKRAYIGGFHGYGWYTLKVTCHDLSCYSKTKTVTFKVKNNCGSTTCEFKVNWPLAADIKHCFDTEGKVTIDAGPWVKGCSQPTFKWITPRKTYHSDWISGHYGYGTYKLEVTCHDASCYGEKKTYSFELVDDCVKHQFDIYCPEDVYVECGAELWNLDVYGDAYYIYNGKKVWLKAPKEHHHLSECNRGYITREWKVKDQLGKWHACMQTIYVGENAEGEPTIKWPTEEIELIGCNPGFTPEDLPAGAQQPYYENDGCSRFGHTYTDDVFYFNSTCKKVVRKWTVYDWCVYIPNSGSKKGRYTFYQTIKISSDEAPQVEVPADMEISADDCKEARVDMYDFEVMIESCGDKFEITNDSPFAIRDGDNASGYYPIGETVVNYTVVYGCGYTKKYKQTINVVNDKAPTPICIESVAVPLMGIDTDDDGEVDAGMVEIWAKDFDHKSEDRCGGDIDFSFSKDELVMNKTFTCADLGENDLRIYVSNGSGESSYCRVTLTIQNNAADIPNCERVSDNATENEEESAEGEDHDTDEEQVDDVEETEDGDDREKASISGRIDFYLGGAVTNADIILSDDDSEMAVDNTGDEGAYIFSELDMHLNYTLQPQMVDQVGRYVSREDSDRLYDHLSGRETITDPLMLLAADLDQNGQLDFVDLGIMVGMERRITYQDEQWLFVASDYEFENPESPWDEMRALSHTINSLEDTDYEMNFVAIRLGDLVHKDFDDLAANNSSRRNRINQASVSPNPFTYRTTINFSSETSQVGQLMIHKINGEKVLDQQVRISKGAQSIDLGYDEMPQAGIYFYNLVLDETTYRGKILKVN